MGVDLARLVVGAVVRLPGANGPVRLISVEPGSFWSFVYEHADGPARITLSEEELVEVELLDVAEAPAFDGDPEQFRLGLEARRIKTTFTYEMAAVAVSNIRPLPHQLEAVYDEFLTQPRLRFLLADDPGAGKTIMAGARTGHSRRGVARCPPPSAAVNDDTDRLTGATGVAAASDPPSTPRLARRQRGPGGGLVRAGRRLRARRGRLARASALQLGQHSYSIPDEEEAPRWASSPKR